MDSYLRRLLPRRLAIICLLLVAVQLVLMVATARELERARPHDAPLAIVAPPIVAQQVAAQANDLPVNEVRAIAAEDASAARDDVGGGVVAAALLIDVSGTSDTLLLPAGADPRLNETLRATIAAVERSRGREVQVEEVGEGSISFGQVNLLALLACVAGLAVMLVISMRLGPVARSFSVGVRRFAAVAVISVVTGVGLVGLIIGAAPAAADWVQLALVAGWAVLLSAVITWALEALAGLAGLTLSLLLFLGPAVPLLFVSDVLLLGSPWAEINRWTPPGIARDTLQALAQHGGQGAGSCLLLLGVWSAVAVSALIVSGRERELAGLAPDDDLDAERPNVSAWRLRAIGVTVPAAALSLVLASLVAHDVVASTARLVSVAAESPCVDAGRVRGVPDLNRVATRLRGSPSFQGGDVGADVLLQDGRRLMVFGDTLRAPGYSGQRFVRNSMLVLGPGCIRSVLPADGDALIPDRVDPEGADIGYWPMSIGAVSRPGYDLVAVMAQRVRTTGEGAFDFENLGPAVAVFVVGVGQPPQLVDVRDLGPDSASLSRPVWGAAAATFGDWVYLYGTAKPDDQSTFGFSLQVARVKIDDLLLQDRWRYWDGARWVRDPTGAEPLIAPVGGTSQTLSVFQYGDRWLALSKRDEALGSDVVVWSAPDPWGPFDQGTVVDSLPSDIARGELRYMPLAHPDLFPEPGTVVISYSRNRTDLEEVLDDPTAYRPHFARVRLPAG